jgi:hypothetical protein
VSPPESQKDALVTRDKSVGVRRLSLRCCLAPEAQGGNRVHTAAEAETTGYARATRRAFDSQPRGRSHSAVSCPARRRCALATRFRQWSVQHPSLTISNRTEQRSIRAASPKSVVVRPISCSTPLTNENEHCLPIEKAVAQGYSCYGYSSIPDWLGAF